jgi:hypothetical protein
MSQNKLSAFLSLVLVFLSGAVLGAFAHRMYVVQSVASQPTTSQPPRRPSPEEQRKHLIEELRSVAKLDDQQIVQLNKIYDDTRERFDAVHKKANTEMRAAWEEQTQEIRKMLRPEQLPLFDEWHAKREQERKNRGRREGGPPPPPSSSR